MGSRHRDISRTVVLLASLLAQKKTCLLFSLFALLVRPLAKKYHVKEIYLFGSYARGEARCPKRSGFSYFWRRWISPH
ncbi:nucleotidyltransferase family protein [Dialister sp. i34-0019-2H8]|uniref:nucleotidyltransferase family protein n=1 Tax=Dialister sp. i34-0019-2H8 TaxID=3141190 RepID=UPI0036F2704E